MICENCKFVFAIEEAYGDTATAKRMIETGRPGYTTVIQCPRCMLMLLVGRVNYRIHYGDFPRGFGPNEYGELPPMVDEGMSPERREAFLGRVRELASKGEMTWSSGLTPPPDQALTSLRNLRKLP